MNFYSLTSKVYDILDITYFAKKDNNPRDAINKIIQDENVQILDMCCGTLSNTIPIAKTHKKAKIIGVDISKQMLQVAKKKIDKNNLNNISLKKSDAANTSLNSNMFDYVVMGLVLHEMTPRLRKNILKEAYRVLKPDGNLIVLEWEEPKSIFQKIIYFPLLILEQVLNKTFFEFYNCNKTQFFMSNNFKISKKFDCNYSTVFELKKVANSDL